MTNTKSQRPASADEIAIRSLIERWAKAVRDENRAEIRAHHDADLLMFDVPPPLVSRGIDAYMETWKLFYSSQEKPVTFEFEDIEITAGADVAFVAAIGRCVNVDDKGEREPLVFRLTMCLRKFDGCWRVMHEHHSLPAA